MMIGKSTSKDIGMGMSPELADLVYRWANWFLVGALVVGVLATYAIIVSGNVKEAALKRELARANEGAAEAQARAAGSMALAADAQKRTAALRARAAQAELKLEELRSKMAPRHLAAEQQGRIAAAIAKYAPQKVRLDAHTDDEESRMFWADIRTALEMAGWTIVETGSFMGPLVLGVEIVVRSEQQGGAIEDAANALASALVTENIHARVAKRSSAGADVLEILVGKKPTLGNGAPNQP